MNFGDLKPGDTLYLIDYNQFKKDLTYIKGLVQSSIINEPQKDANALNPNMLQLMKQAGLNTQQPQTLTVTALFNGVQFPFTVTKEMSIARADNRTVCITKDDVLQEIRVRKTDATNQLKSLDRYNKILEECEKVEKELLGEETIQSNPDSNRLEALERKIEELSKLIINGKTEESTQGINGE